MISKSVEETKEYAGELAGDLKSREREATVVALSGNLGSGKTTFAKAFAGQFGIHEHRVSSPTFVIMKSYDLDQDKYLFKKFIHVDAYRLERAEDIEKLGWQKFLRDPGNLILVEWPQNIGAAMPESAMRISFSHIDENTREIVFN